MRLKAVRGGSSNVPQDPGDGEAVSRRAAALLLNFYGPLKESRNSDAHATERYSIVCCGRWEFATEASVEWLVGWMADVKDCEMGGGGCIGFALCIMLPVLRCGEVGLEPIFFRS